MHTWYYRLNALLTFATTVLAVMCAVASLTEVFHKSQPSIREPVVNVDGLMPERRNDRAWLSLDLDADLRSVFNWNTKQVYLFATVDYTTRRNHLNRITIFDTIIKEANLAHIKASKARIQFPFSLTDQGSGLKGTGYNITIAWQSVPWTGLLLTGRKSFPGYNMPPEYTGSGRDQSRRWAL